MTPYNVSHDFLNQDIADDGTPHICRGYPDESFRFTRFIDFLAGVIQGKSWDVHPSRATAGKAIIVDFVSKNQDQAESSVSHGWNGAKKLTVGVINTVHSRTETNEQNARIGRHLAVVATGMTQAAFCDAVVEKLLDAYTCAKLSCEICCRRITRTLADVVQILAVGTKQSEVHLFAKWSPNCKLLDLLAADGIALRSHPLSDVPLETLEANRYYHVWDGTAKQAAEFWERTWRPS